MSDPSEQLPNDDKARFYRTLDGLDSLSKTRVHFMEDNPEEHLFVLYDAMGRTISALVPYLATGSHLLSSNELNEIAKKLGELTASLRTEGPNYYKSKNEKYMEGLNTLDKILVEIFAEWTKRLKADGKFLGAKETIAGCVENWLEQKGKIHSDCTMVLRKLDDLILVALDEIKKGRVD